MADAKTLYEVEINHTADRVELVPLPDRKKRRVIDVTTVPAAWDFFRATEVQLIDRLCEYASGSRIRISHADAEAFARCSERVQRAAEEWAGLDETPVQREVEPEPVQVKPPAPVVKANAVKEAEKQLAERVEIRQESREQVRATGLDATEKRLNALQNTINTVSGGMHLLIYDIPDRLSKTGVCPNPSGLLWHYSFRLNLSCWVLSDKGLNACAVQDLMSHWRKHDGVKFDVIPFHDSALEQIREIARVKLAEEIVRIHRSLIERIDNASKALEEARKEIGPEITDRQMLLTERTKDNKVRSILKDAQESMKASIDCAVMFDEMGSVQDLLTALRSAIRAQTNAFNAQMMKKGGILAPAVQ